MNRALHRVGAMALMAAAIALVGLILTHIPVQANDISVGMTCTITEAITAANTDTAVNGCPAGSGADTVILESNFPYVLTTIDNGFGGVGNNGLPPITSTITISGNGATIERKLSAPDFRILYVDTTGNLTLQQVTVRQGRLSGTNNGGGIYNAATLTVVDSSIVSNTASYGGGIFNTAASSANISNSAVLSNTSNTSLPGGGGGGIYNTSGSLIIDASNVLSNTTNRNGGGIFNGGILTVTSTSLLNNTGGMDGGGIYQASGNSAVTGSCIVANSAAAFQHATGTPINATGNWWGHPSGPAGEGPGIGDAVSADVDFSGFLTAALSGCPTLPSPDVGIVKRASPGPLNPGAAMTYTLVFSNSGPITATAVVITDPVPSSVTGFSYVSAGAPITPHLGTTYVFTVSDLAPGAGGSITINGTISSSSAGTTFTNTATIDAKGDLTPANNTSAAGIAVNPIYLLTVTKDGSGTGTVTGTGINCDIVDTDCSGGYLPGTKVTLQATASADSQFTGWTGCDSAAGAACTVTMNSDRTVKATFLRRYTLTITKDGSGSGAVTSIDTKISCGSVCTTTYLDGASVSLSASPDSSSTFTGWGGVCSGTGGCLVTMSGDKTVSATFDALPVSIVLTQTVGIDRFGCASSTTVTVLPGTPVYYCYTVRNTGERTFTRHGLVTNGRGAIFADQLYTLAPGQQVNTAQLNKTISQTVIVTTTTVATWTASLDAADLALVAADELLRAAGTDLAVSAIATTQGTVNVAPAGMNVAVTVGTQANACSTTQSILVKPETAVYFCVTLRNTDSVALTDLVLQVNGQQVPLKGLTLTPGGAATVTSADSDLLGPVTVTETTTLGAAVTAVAGGGVQGTYATQSTVDAVATPGVVNESVFLPVVRR